MMAHSCIRRTAIFLVAIRSNGGQRSARNYLAQPIYMSRHRLILNGADVFKFPNVTSLISANDARAVAQ